MFFIFSFLLLFPYYTVSKHFLGEKIEGNVSKYVESSFSNASVMSFPKRLQGPIIPYIKLNPPHTEPLIPKWSLGYWQSGWGDEKLGYAHQDSFLDHAKALRGAPNQYGNHTYPADVMVLDMYWCDLNWNWPNNMIWSYSRYPDPEGMIQELHSMNYKFAMNFHESGFGDEWLAKMKQYLGWGLDIVWLDFWKADSSEEVTVWNLLKEIHGENKRIFFFGRHYARPNKYNYEANPYGNLGYDKAPFNQPIEKSMPMHWTGDQGGSWHGFMETIEGIVYGVDGAMDGWSYLHADTPGHIGGDDPELANRWIQFSDFSPFTRNHGASARDVWSWGEKVEENSRFSRMLRYRLLPYIYTYCWIIYEKAIPLTRPLKLAYPSQRDDIRFQYMFGEEFLVSPVYQARSYFVDEKMDVYLPSGEEWVDYWTHERYTGGQTIKVDISEKNDKFIPLFVKRGAIIPMGQQIYFINEEIHPNPLTLDIYPLNSGSSSFELYDDDGKSMEYANGKYSLTNFLCIKNTGSITIQIGKSQGSYQGKPSSQDYILKINLIDDNYKKITNDGIELEKISDYKEILLDNATPNTWAFDSENKIIYLRLKTSVDDSHTINCLAETYTQILTSIRVTPGVSTINPVQNQQFSAEGLDQYGKEIVGFSPNWSTSGGKISSSGLFESTAEGDFRISANSNGITGEARINVSNSAIVSGRYYKITARHSGKVLDVAGGSKDNGATVQQYDSNGTPSQRWKIIDLGDSFYKLEPECSGKVLEVSNSSIVDGGRVQQWDYANIDCQIWNIVEVEKGFFMIINVNSGKVLDVESYSMDDRALVHQWTYKGAANQQWSLTLLDSLQLSEKFAEI